MGCASQQRGDYIHRYAWLEIECSRCKARRDVDLAALPHVSTTFFHDLASRLVCQKCRRAGKRPAAMLLQLVPRSRHQRPANGESGKHGESRKDFASPESMIEQITPPRKLSPNYCESTDMTGLHIGASSIRRCRPKAALNPNLLMGGSGGYQGRLCGNRSLPLSAPAKQSERAKAGGVQWQSGGQWSDGYVGNELIGCSTLNCRPRERGRL